MWHLFAPLNCTPAAAVPLTKDHFILQPQLRPSRYLAWPYLTPFLTSFLFTPLIKNSHSFWNHTITLQTSYYVCFHPSTTIHVSSKLSFLLWVFGMHAFTTSRHLLHAPPTSQQQQQQSTNLHGPPTHVYHFPHSSFLSLVLSILPLKHNVSRHPNFIFRPISCPSYVHVHYTPSGMQRNYTFTNIRGGADKSLANFWIFFFWVACKS